MVDVHFIFVTEGRLIVANLEKALIIQAMFDERASLKYTSGRRYWLECRFWHKEYGFI